MPGAKASIRWSSFWLQIVENDNSKPATFPIFVLQKFNELVAQNLRQSCDLLRPEQHSYIDSLQHIFFQDSQAAAQVSILQFHIPSAI